VTATAQEFLRSFQYQVLPGRAADYAAYLREVVEPIDRQAHADGAFEEVFTVEPLARQEPPMLCRVFRFRDEAQLQAFAGRMAQAAARFDASAQATAQRKAHAETLRTLVGVHDYRVTR